MFDVFYKQPLTKTGPQNKPPVTLHDKPRNFKADSQS